MQNTSSTSKIYTRLLKNDRYIDLVSGVGGKCKNIYAFSKTSVQGDSQQFLSSVALIPVESRLQRKTVADDQ